MSDEPYKTIEELPSEAKLARLQGPQRDEVYRRLVATQYSVAKDNPLRAAANGRLWTMAMQSQLRKDKET